MIQQFISLSAWFTLLNPTSQFARPSICMITDSCPLPHARTCVPLYWGVKLPLLTPGNSILEARKGSLPRWTAKSSANIQPTDQTSIALCDVIEAINYKNTYKRINLLQKCGNWISLNNYLPYDCLSSTSGAL